MIKICFVYRLPFCQAKYCTVYACMGSRQVHQTKAAPHKSNQVFNSRLSMDVVHGILYINREHKQQQQLQHLLN